MSEVVLDSSAVLALLQSEPGSRQVEETLPGALLSAVNLSEVLTRLCENGVPISDARQAARATGVVIVDFDADQASLAAAMRAPTKTAGLSLGDRACLALARIRRAPAMTADRAWARLSGFDVVLVRR